MASRIITAKVTSGSNTDHPAGAFVTFGTITSDTGVVKNATPVSATLYLSKYKTYTIYGKLNVIFGDKNGTVVATTASTLEKNTEEHDGTHALTNLSSKLLTTDVSTITLGVIATVTTTSNRINIRTGSYLTLTIDYELNHKTMGYYNGSSWAQCVPYHYDGSSWKQCDPYFYTGSAWKECNGS